MPENNSSRDEPEVQEAPERVRVILDCDWEDLPYALEMVIAAKPDFRDGRGPGWGWSYGRPGRPRLFVRRTKQGYSASADRSNAR